VRIAVRNASASCTARHTCNVRSTLNGGNLKDFPIFEKQRQLYHNNNNTAHNIFSKAFLSHFPASTIPHFAEIRIHPAPVPHFTGHDAVCGTTRCRPQGAKRSSRRNWRFRPCGPACGFRQALRPSPRPVPEKRHAVAEKETRSGAGKRGLGVVPGNPLPSARGQRAKGRPVVGRPPRPVHLVGAYPSESRKDRHQQHRRHSY
jgi:hypothetical protein